MRGGYCMATKQMLELCSINACTCTLAHALLPDESCDGAVTMQ
jgi:hypothetical protein